jgi:hypothetical protein
LLPRAVAAALTKAYEKQTGTLFYFSSEDEFESDETAWVTTIPSDWTKANERIFGQLVLKTKQKPTGDYVAPVLTARVLPKPFPYSALMTVSGKPLLEPSLWTDIKDDSDEEEEELDVAQAMTPIKLEDIVGMKRTKSDK